MTSTTARVAPLVSATEVVADLPALTVLDVRYRLGAPADDTGRTAHARGHVPGSAYVDLGTALAGPVGDGRAGRHPLPDPDDFAAAMRAAGVRADRPVVVLDDWGGRAAARCWWLLRHHGHRDVRVLDGGWPAWVAAGGEVQQGLVTPQPGDFVATATDRDDLVVADRMPEVDVLLDARAPERFRGEVEPVDPVAGHVPGARNAPTEDNLAPDGRLRPAEELQAAYAGVGAVPGADVAVYCGSGVTACHDLLALEVAGVPARLYAGSWSEWVSDPSRPVARGAVGPADR